MEKINELPWIERELASIEKTLKMCKRKNARDRSKFVNTIRSLTKQRIYLEDIYAKTLAEDVPLEAHRWKQIPTWLKAGFDVSMIAKATGTTEATIEVYRKIDKEVGGYSYLDDDNTKLDSTWLRTTAMHWARNTDSTAYYEGGVFNG